MSEIEQTPTIGGRPGGSGPRAPAPIPGQPVPLSANLSQEYVSATGLAFYGNYWRSLTWSFDDITVEFGADLYERMLRDPQVIACVNVLKAGILEDGAQLRPAIADKRDTDYQRACDLVAECEEMLNDLQPSFDDTLWNLLDGLALGHKVAEIVWNDDATRIRAVKVKPRDGLAFVVDIFNNTIGLMARIPGVGVPVQAGTFLIGAMPPYNLLPREKFAVFTFRPKDNDPRGTSILRPGYNAWWLKMQTWPEYLKFLAQHGSPSLIGYVSKAKNTIKQANGTTLTPQQQMLAALIQFRSGSAGAFDEGDKIDVVDVAMSGVEAFGKAFDLYDRQITTAILHQTLATMEGEHQARAASQTHQGVLNTIIRQAKRALQRMIRNDILRVYVRFAHGPEVERLTPLVTLGSAAQQDLSGLMNSVANLARARYFDESQFPGIDELLNLPARQMPTEEEQQAERDRGAQPPPPPPATESDETNEEEDNEQSAQPTSISARAPARRA